MNHIPEAELAPSPSYPPARKRTATWIWLLLGALIAVVAVPCLALVAWISYMGTYGPETWVYTGNQVPGRFTKVMKENGALDEGEELLFFYSDAMTDIEDGYYFVSDRKVVVYTSLAGDAPLTVVQFDEIEDVSLDRDESFFVDSQIMIHLKDGGAVAFPVSSEYDRDEEFFEAISKRIPHDGAGQGGDRADEPAKSFDGAKA